MLLVHDLLCSEMLQVLLLHQAEKVKKIFHAKPLVPGLPAPLSPNIFLRHCIMYYVPISESPILEDLL